MPERTIRGARLHYQDEGAPGKGTILFSHGLLWSGWMFDAQVAALKDRYRCVRWDHRGQGQSEITRDGYSMDEVTEDGLALVRELNVETPFHFVGLSMGGFVGMRLAARHPDMVKSLVLLETSADPEPAENVPKYRALGFVARWLSLRLVESRVMPIMFSKSFLADPAKTAVREEARRRLRANHRVGITRALRGVIERPSIYEELSKIRCPTTVVVGEEDVATVPAKAERLAAAIAGARLVRIPGAGHTSSVEQPDAVTRAIEEGIGERP